MKNPLTSKRGKLRPTRAEHQKRNGNGDGDGDPPEGWHQSGPAEKGMPRNGGDGEESKDFRIIVIGASAGGVEALRQLTDSLPGNLNAAVFVVLHVSPTGPSLLPAILTRPGRVPAIHGRDGEKIVPGKIYIAPPDHHLLIKPRHMVISRGPRENSARPAIDPLFRTAARSYGPWVVGVILSGGLDDGTLGLMDIKRFGGVAIVQDPAEAMFPSMPNSAIENVHVDRVATLDEIASLLARLAREPVSAEERGAFMALRKDSLGPDIAEVGNDDLKTRNMDGPPSKFTCPECGGALWEIENGRLLRYRCHIGHAYTSESLMAAQGQRLEDALWTALRSLEETAAMRRRMAERARRNGWERMARAYNEQAELAQERAGLLRSVLVEQAPARITAESAEATESKALLAVDLDAGRAKNSESSAPGALDSFGAGKTRKNDRAKSRKAR